MVRQYIQRFKSFFRGLVTGGRDQVIVKGGADLVIDSTARIGFEGAGGDTYISHVAANDWRFYLDGGILLRLRAGVIRMYGDLLPDADITYNIGGVSNRYINGYVSTEVGIHSGAAFTDSIVPNILTIASKAAITGGLASVEEMLLGGAVNIPTVPTQVTEGNITTPVNGMMYYNSTLNAMRVYENGGWRNM